MRRWGNFLDSLDSDGGHLLLLIVLMLVGLLCSCYGATEARGIVTGAFGALLLALRHNGSNSNGAH